MNKKIRGCLLSLFILSSSLLAANEVEVKSENKPESKENIKDDIKEESKDLLDFSSIKDIIKKDGLEGELKKKQDEKRKYLDVKKLKDMKRFNVPNQDIFWSFFSELWLVKNATMLKWDVHKPDFELEKAFTTYLESQGHYEKKIKILLVDTTEIAHAALPSNQDEFIFILSLPFIRTLDLSKVEISLILFEDFIRVKKGYFKNYILDKELENFLGSNFTGKPFDKKMIDTHLKKYNQVLFEKGFSFQEQFETTKELDILLKSDLKMWNTYLTLLEKIDALTKNNALYKKYGQIYPSPELQLSWLKPKGPIL
ncbi:MAG: hypothetical protein Q7U04_08930 [Bacteriovorax sp.]|nr:hypothetical protein [Bacteriovorax sp.]